MYGLRQSDFLDEAHRLGRQLADAALRHEGLATWLTDRYACEGERWLQTVGTLDGSLGTGTAGVGLFLAKLAETTNDNTLRPVATESLWHSIKQAEALVEDFRIGWADGSSGIAWAALTAGRILRDESLEAAGNTLTSRSVRAVRRRPVSPARPGLLEKPTGTLAGLLCLAGVQHEPNATRELVDERATEFAAYWNDALAIPGIGRIHGDATRVGLARGLSGTGLVLSAWSALSGNASGRHAAEKLFARERAWLEPASWWSGDATTPWVTPRTDLASSWYTGASGIGLARLCHHEACKSTTALAEVGAAIELVRPRSQRPGDDLSLCFGLTGTIEFYLQAGVTLAESAHVDAARRLGQRMIERAGSSRHYATGLGPNTRNPSLLHGIAGCGMTLMRLHDPEGLPSHAIPSFGHS